MVSTTGQLCNILDENEKEIRGNGKDLPGVEF